MTVRRQKQSFVKDLGLDILKALLVLLVYMDIRNIMGYISVSESHAPTS